MAHSILAPSSAGVWSKCPGWVTMNRLHPSESGSAAREGTVVHEIGERLLRISLQSVGRLLNEDALEPIALGEIVDGIAVSGEMIAAAGLYAKTCATDCHKFNVFDDLGIEESVTISAISPECHGTPDFYLYDKKLETLRVYDLKYGFGVVEVVENMQLLAYALGIIERLGVKPKYVELIVVQPRAYHSDGPVRRWRLNDFALPQYVEDLKLAAEDALGESPTYRSGSHCRYCPGRHSCAVAIEAGFTMYEVSASGSLPMDISADALSLQLDIVTRAAEQLGYIKTGLEAEVEAKLKKGETVPGYVMRSKSGALKWNKSDKEVLEVGSMFGVDVTKKTILTPKQVTDAGIPAEVVAQYASRPSSMKLTKDDGSEAVRIFSKGK